MLARIPLSAAVLLLPFLALLAATPAHAEDAGTPALETPALVQALEADARVHRRDRDAAALLGDVAAAAALHADAAAHDDADGLRKRLVRLVGRLTKARDDGVQRAALRALGTMADAGGVRYLKPFLRPVRDERADAATREALEAAAAIGDDALVVPLLRMVEDSKNLEIKRRAVAALGAFGGSGRYRERILEDLVDVVRPHVPGGAKRGQQSRVTDAWIPGRNGDSGSPVWNALSSVLPEALGRLTGRTAVSTRDWIALVHQHRRNLSALFPERED